MATSYALRRAAQAELRDNIRQAARNQGWTLTQAAKEAGVSYSKLTQGLAAARWFLRDEVDALATAFEMSATELMGGSVFKDDAPGSRFDGPTNAQRLAEVGTGKGRALCCECGVMRRFNVAEVDYQRQVSDSEYANRDLTGRRMVVPLHCRICGRETNHAELRTDPGHRDYAEALDHSPDREALAQHQLQQMIDRLAEFNVDVHYRRYRAKTRHGGYASGVNYDKAKSRWHIDVDANAPTRLKVILVQECWKKVAMNDFGDIDWDPKQSGVIYSSTSHAWEIVTEDLIADITRYMAVERNKLFIEARDSANGTTEANA